MTLGLSTPRTAQHIRCLFVDVVSYNWNKKQLPNDCCMGKEREH